MTTPVLVPALLAVLLATPATVRSDDCPSFHTHGCSAPARWAMRHDAGDARIAITTEDGDATLLLTDQVVAMQLSDRTLHRLRQRLRREEDAREEDGGDALGIGTAIRATVFSAVRTLLDHSAEVPVRQLRDVDYRDGRLRFTTASGGGVFDDVDVNDRDVTASFRDRDALAFVREFRRLKAMR